MVLGYEMFRALVRPDLGFEGDGEQGKAGAAATTQSTPTPATNGSGLDSGGSRGVVDASAANPRKRGPTTPVDQHAGPLKRRAPSSAGGSLSDSASSGEEEEEDVEGPKLPKKEEGAAPQKERVAVPAPNRAVRAARRALCRPGPDVVILDEGHRMRSHKSQLYRAVRRVRTRRRIVLSACPLQNHLIEYFHMVDCVRPGFLGTRQAFRAYFEKVIKAGLLRNSMGEDIAAARQRAFVLSQQLRPVVLRRCVADCSAALCLSLPLPVSSPLTQPPPSPAALRSGPEHLTPQLPRKREWVVHCRLSDLQAQLYKAFLRDRQLRIMRAEAKRQERRVRGEAVVPRDPGNEGNPDILAAYQVGPAPRGCSEWGGEPTMCPTDTLHPTYLPVPPCP